MAEKRDTSARSTKKAADKTVTRTAAKAVAGAAKSSRARKAPAAEPTPEERWRMVAEAAYYIAEKRGFVGGDPAQDWYEAEKQVADFLEKTQRPARAKAKASASSSATATA